MDFHQTPFVWFSILSLKLALIFGQEEAPVVTIADGKLRGTVNQTVEDNITYYAFRGIPFAKKPVGNLRFAAPVKNTPWTGILDATQDKDACTQSLAPFIVGPDGGILGSEDCLYISVYTKNLCGSLPVMVWIYGGSFVNGASSYDTYAPDYIIEKDVVYVSFNYRLGIFGFLSTEDCAAYGNWGLKDQVLALKWVKDNIARFGGDPKKITIFGQSAGAASVSYLVQNHLTKGLFKGAIMQSGTSLCLWALTLNARRKAFIVGNSLGIITLNSQTLINELRKVDYKKLKMAESNVTSVAFLTDNILTGFPFGVVEEPIHADAVFSSESHELLRKGEFHKIPLIIGYTSNEVASLPFFVNILQLELLQYDLDKSRLAPYDLTQNSLRRLQASTNIRSHYFTSEPIVNQPAAMTNFLTVDQFNRPVRETVNIVSDYTDAYYYKFSYRGLLGNADANYSGVGHSEDLNYLFARRGPSSPMDSIIRQKFVALLTNFAKYGNPTSLGGDAILGNTTWVANTPKHDTDKIIKYLNINESLTMENNPDQSDWEFYQAIYKTYGSPPYTTY